jgi:septation ring formation regulator EzrA
MKHHRHFETIQSETAPRETAQIRTLIADLDRIVRILDCDITAEEERARVFDRSDARYPILARTLAARRRNLGKTIAALEKRLMTIKAPLFEPVAA